MERALLGPAPSLVRIVRVACGRFAVFAVAFLPILASSREACADDPYVVAPSIVPTHVAEPRVTWASSRTVSTASHEASTSSRDLPDSPVVRARDSLLRARSLDEAASLDERAADEIAAKLQEMMAAAKGARATADKSPPETRERLKARADDLEVDVAVSEAEITDKRRTAADQRSAARELRSHALALVRQPQVVQERAALASASASASCDPPFSYTPEGHKVYRVACLK